MTTLQLLQRLTRFLTHKDVRTLPPADLQELLDAANVGLGEYVEMLPHIRRSAPRILTLPASVDKTITATADDATIAFSPAFSGQTSFYGCSCVVANDSGRYNRLAGLNTLLGAHRGASGSTTLTLYGDALQFGQTADAIDGPVQLSDGNRSKELCFERPEYWRSWIPDQLEVGTPLRWWVEPLNGLEGLEAPAFLLRVWPAPVAAMDLTFKVRLFPVALEFADVETPRQMPVPVLEEAHLVNLCAPGLASSRLWNTALSSTVVDKAYSRSKLYMESIMQRRGHTRRGKIYTPRYF